MNPLQQSHHSVVISLLSTTLPAGIPFAGNQSDFSFGILVTILTIATAICVGNILFLRKYQFTRRQLEAAPIIKLLKAMKALAAFRFPPWAQILANFMGKVVFFGVVYSFDSAKGIEMVAIGLGLTVILFSINIHLVFRLIFHSRSVFNRKHVFFKRNREFYRARLILELCRRVLYFTMAFTYFSYGIHRLNPSAYSGSMTTSPIFVLHFWMNLNGLTGHGTSSLAPATVSAIILDCLQATIKYGILALLVNAVLGGMNYEKLGSKNKLRHRRTLKLTLDVGSSPTTDRDIRAAVELYVEYILDISPSALKGSCDLFVDLGADKIDIAGLLIELEGYFEIPRTSSPVLSSLRTIDDFVAYVASKLRIQTQVNSQLMLMPLDQISANNNASRHSVVSGKGATA